MRSDKKGNRIILIPEPILMIRNVDKYDARSGVTEVRFKVFPSRNISKENENSRMKKINNLDCVCGSSWCVSPEILQLSQPPPRFHFFSLRSSLSAASGHFLLT
jgi:hypothetical protein